MIDWIKNIFNLKMIRDYSVKTGSTLYIDRIPSEEEKEQFRIANNLGISKIEKGDKFEGWSCSYFFKDQICTNIEGDVIYGTTTLAVFKKENIRLI